MKEKKSNVFKVRGGLPIQGTITPQGNKNEAIPVISASLLTEDEVCLYNVPYIEDLNLMQEILRDIGTNVSYDEKNMTLSLESKGTLRSRLPIELCGKLRGLVTLAGPLLARNGEVFLPRPGGDRIGRRRLDTHFMALEALGARIKYYTEGYEITCTQLKGADILLDEASVTATENAICAACVAEGESIIRNAASEPHVQGLCEFLKIMGAKIEGISSNTLRIEGVKKLTTGRKIEHRIGADYLEVGSFIVLAALRGGKLSILNTRPSDLRMIRMVFARLGIQCYYEKDVLIVPPSQSIEVINDVGNAVPHIDSSPWPGFPADMTSVALVAATQAKGTVLIHEKMFESRLFFTDRLIAMGANIILCDPHRAVVIGPSPLSAAKMSSPDIRAGMALLIAALCADGVSIIQNIAQIDRGFSRIEERLRSVGADIVREN